jgi:hypothetical protein
MLPPSSPERFRGLDQAARLASKNIVFRIARPGSSRNAEGFAGKPSLGPESGVYFQRG